MTASAWIKNIQPNPEAELRLFCFPFAGGGASFYRSWAAELPGHIELCAIQLPGRENRMREPAVTSMPDMVRILARELAPFFDRPFAFFGHSMGALLCFFLARELRRQAGPMPRHLFLSGRAAPHIPLRGSAMHRMDDEEFVRQLRRHNGTAEAVLEDKEVMAFFLPILRADFTLVENAAYRDEAVLSCPITVFGGLADKTVDWKVLRAWQELTSGAFALRLFAGEHFYLQQNRRDFLAALVLDLESLLGDRRALSYA